VSHVLYCYAVATLCSVVAVNGPLPPFPAGLPRPPLLTPLGSPRLPPTPLPTPLTPLSFVDSGAAVVSVDKEATELGETRVRVCSPVTGSGRVSAGLADGYAS
jgi:hypothetical protein